MNAKLTVKKLKLMKETLRDLTAQNAGAVKGGGTSLRPPTVYTCKCKVQSRICPTKKQTGC